MLLYISIKLSIKLQISNENYILDILMSYSKSTFTFVTVTKIGKFRKIYIKSAGITGTWVRLAIKANENKAIMEIIVNENKVLSR